MVTQMSRHATAMPARDAHPVLDQARAAVAVGYRAAVGRLPAEIRHVAGYHAGWWDADGAALDGGGKALRPALALCCARAAGAASPAAALAAAVAVEVMHDFSLLHDDVMDGDRTRRHRPTAWVVFGVSQAILAGDALIALAMEQAAQVPGGGGAVLSLALVDLCAGQCADITFERRDQVTISECVDMADGKTGALLGAACELGALAGGADAATAGRYRQFGRHLGIAFQLVDDDLGIWGDPQRTGKPVGADLAARKRSLPVVAALASGTPAGDLLAGVYRRDEPLDEEAVTYATALVEAAGGRSWARAEAARRVELAHAALDATRPDEEAAADLRALAALVTRRDH
ncbi:MAG TPA: polyprenyl synthetase family protein [Trebonia sp.]|nr:polyprenyl synthetase family protein [Trebonia sp.]